MQRPEDLAGEDAVDASIHIRPVLLAEAEDVGLSRGQLRSLRWRRLSHGLYVPRSSGLAVDEEARALSDLLPATAGSDI